MGRDNRGPFLHSLWLYTMHRCVGAGLAGALSRARLSGALIFSAALVASLSVPSHAFAQPTRKFPGNALRGELQITQPPDALLNGAPARLAPGARIRGEDNLVHLSGTWVGRTLLVNYTLDGLGLVKDVWVLQPGEAAKQPWPTTPEQAMRWRFDADAQAWSR